MPLALIVDSLDSVPEALRGAYVQDGDKFKLDAEIEDTSALKGALNKERGTRGALEKQIKAWQGLGKTPDEISEMLSKQAELEAEAAKKRGDFDGILKQHQTKWDSERTSLVSERDTALNVARSATVDSGIKSALVGGKATAEGVKLLPKILGERVKTEFVDGEFVTSIMQSDGKTPMIGSGPNGAATYDDLVKEAVKDFPSLFEGTGGGGGGKPPKDNAGGSGKAKTLTLAEFHALDPIERAAKMKEGFKVVD